MLSDYYFDPVMAVSILLPLALILTIIYYSLSWIINEAINQITPSTEEEYQHNQTLLKSSKICDLINICLQPNTHFIITKPEGGSVYYHSRSDVIRFFVDFHMGPDNQNKNIGIIRFFVLNKLILTGIIQSTRQDDTTQLFLSQTNVLFVSAEGLNNPSLIDFVNRYTSTAPLETRMVDTLDLPLKISIFNSIQKDLIKKDVFLYRLSGYFILLLISLYYAWFAYFQIHLLLFTPILWNIYAIWRNQSLSEKINHFFSLIIGITIITIFSLNGIKSPPPTQEEMNAKAAKKTNKEICGSKPQRDFLVFGNFRKITNYLEETINDPDSLKIKYCTNATKNESGAQCWSISCEYYYRNTQGGVEKHTTVFDVGSKGVIKTLHTWP